MKDFESTKEKVSDKINNALWFLDIALEENKFPIKPKDFEFDDLKTYLPYCIHETNAECMYILVNRNYSPIGEGCGWVNYENFPYYHIKLNKDELKSLGLNSANTFWEGFINSPFASLSNAYEYRVKLKQLLNILESKK